MITKMINFQLLYPKNDKRSVSVQLIKMNSEVRDDYRRRFVEGLRFCNNF